MSGCISRIGNLSQAFLHSFQSEKLFGLLGVRFGMGLSLEGIGCLGCSGVYLGLCKGVFLAGVVGSFV